jgi:hypothetical protein
MLLDTIARLLHRAQTRAALLLNVSRLAGLREGHRRVLHMLMTEAAGRRDGQLFALPNADLLLITDHDALEAGAASVCGMLATCLATVGGSPAVWWRIFQLATEMPDLLALVQARLAEAAHEMPAEAAVAPYMAALAGAPPALRQQTAIRLPQGGSERGLRPLFQQIAWPPGEALAAGHGNGRDLCLEHHLADREEPRALARLLQSPPQGLHPDPGVTLHLALSPAGVMLPAFGGFAAACHANGRRLRVEIGLLDAAADPAGFAAAAAALRAAGVDLVLAGITPAVAGLCQPWELPAVLFKLVWKTSPLAEAAALVRRLGAARLVLCEADDETALEWGLSQGIRQFQGRRIDAMLAASRRSHCASGAGCTLRQCGERAAALDGAGRAGCDNPALLQRVVP